MLRISIYYFSWFQIGNHKTYRTILSRYLIIPLHQLCLKIENDSFAQNRFFFLEQCGLLGSDGKYSNQPVPVPRLTAEST